MAIWGDAVLGVGGGTSAGAAPRVVSQSQDSQSLAEAKGEKPPQPVSMALYLRIHDFAMLHGSQFPNPPSFCTQVPRFGVKKQSALYNKEQQRTAMSLPKPG